MIRRAGISAIAVLAVLAALYYFIETRQPDFQRVHEVTTTNQRFQVLEGWGSSLAWWSNPQIVTDPRWRNAFLDLGLNILRIDMNKDVLVAADGRFDTPVPMVDDLSKNIELMRFDVDSVRVFGETARWLSQNALEPDRVRITGSIWSPPHWMKGPTGESQTATDGTGPYPTLWLTGDHTDAVDAGTGASIGGRLLTENRSILRQYGSYVASWVVGFERAYGVTLDAISLQNESTFENPFDSMVLDVGADRLPDYTQYALALAAVRSAWRANGLTTKIMGPHVAQVGPTPDDPWGLLAQMRMIRGVMVFPDPTLIDFLDYFNSNYYMPADEAGAEATAGYYHGSSSVDADWARGIDVPGVSWQGKPIWFSESGGEDRQWLNGPDGTPGTGAATVAVKIFNALTHADAVAYVYWLFLHPNPDRLDQSLLGLADLDRPLGSKKYVAFRHFSRFIRPGAARIQATFENGQSSILGSSRYDTLHGLSVVAFLHDDDRTLSYVVLNMTPNEQEVSISLPGGVQVDAFDAYRSSGFESFTFTTASVVSGKTQVTLPPHSIVTLIGNLGT